ncbi:MAG: hypothetical protein BGO96_05205 [Micrococcales bacterium 73-15]|nr:MAG: hypothetical protein BGO96_05205 [Micrococcales bacterium 73-15]
MLILAGPFAILFLAVYVVPLVYAMQRSLFQVRSSGLGFGPSEDVFVGFANYASVLADAAFWAAVGRVFLYGVIQIPVMLVLAMLIALLIDSRAVWRPTVFRLTTFLPYAVPGIVATLLWTYLYVPQLSPIVKGLHAIGWQVDLLGQQTVLLSVANIAIWSWTGYNVVIYTAALQAIPQDLVEAARIDGAGEAGIAVRIKVPLIRGSVGLTALLSMIGTVQLFNEPYILKTVTTAVSSDWTPMMMALNTTFGANDFERGSAISIVIALIAGVLAVIYQLASTRSERSA